MDANLRSGSVGSRVSTTGSGNDSDAWSRNVSLDDLVGRFAQGYKTIEEMVYDVIKQGIVNAAFAPGERLRQEALADAIGVSRIPVRSALIRLESEGLVLFHPRRGAIVRSLTRDQISEIYELRELLEAYALRKAMPGHDQRDLAELRELAQALDSAGSEFADKWVPFYRKLYDFEHNPRLGELIVTLRSAVGRYLLGWKVSGHTGNGAHQGLVDKVAAGDVDVAEACLRAHLQRVRMGIEEIMLKQMATVTETPTTRRPRISRKATP